MTTAIKTCKHHGETLFRWRYRGKDHTSGTYVCIACLAEDNINRRIKNKQRAIEYMGGCCQDCGLVTECLDVYDFHHEGDKESKPNALINQTSNWDLIKAELDKCTLCCANCHRRRHAKLECCKRQQKGKE